MMNKENIISINKKLVQEIENTQSRISEYKDLTKPIAPENAIGRVSRMDAINNKSVVEAALRESERKLDQLLDMQKNITGEIFGICIKCKSEIPFGRLLIRPQSKCCVKCAS
jgi:DnaK suppressor protein